MDERVMQFRVGVMVFATLIITGILLVMFGELPGIIHRKYAIEITFPSAPGVKKETPVRKSGILIGRVTKVKFAKDEEGRDTAAVVVTAEIQGDKRLYQNDICYVQTSLLGDASLEFVRVDDPKIPTAEIADGAKIRGYVQVDPAQLMSDLQGTLDQTIGSVTHAAGNLSLASQKLRKTLDTVNVILDENQQGFKTAVDQANLTLASVRKVSDAVHNVIGDDDTQKRLRRSLEQMPEIVQETHNTIVAMQDTMGKVDANLDNMQQFTAKLGSPEMLERIDRGTQNLERLMSELTLFSQKINSPTGSLGKLMNDPELYCHLNRAARNIDELTRQLKPIVADARVFSDKIARHPELLGVRGAIQRNPGIK